LTYSHVISVRDNIQFGYIYIYITLHLGEEAKTDIIILYSTYTCYHTIASSQAIECFTCFIILFNQLYSNTAKSEAFYNYVPSHCQKRLLVVLKMHVRIKTTCLPTRLDMSLVYIRVKYVIDYGF